MCCGTYAIILSTKLINCNSKLLINKLIIVALLLNIFNSTLEVVWDLLIIDQKIDFNNTVLVIIDTVNLILSFSVFSVVIDLRNRILIESQKMLLLTRFLISMTIISAIAAPVSGSLLSTAPSTMVAVLVGSLEIGRAHV